MPTAPTTPPDITDLSTPPNRLGTSDTVFVAAVDTFFGELPTFGTEQNTLADWEFSTAGEVYANANESFASAQAAASSAADSLDNAQAAASSVNYVGEWSTLTGAYNLGVSVSNNGSFWRLKANLADITLSEPTPTNTDWEFASGSRFVSYTASASINRNSVNQILATSTPVDLTQPTFSVDDFVVITNSKESTQTVRLLNPSNTLIFRNGTISAGDNAVINPGDTVSLRARTPTILERF